ncbi:MAG: hypothetical protein KIT58_03100 [Planctomycetota bacterium]|nr:hypothetical protein [Planctomycetota bacterium]
MTISKAPWSPNRTGKSYPGRFALGRASVYWQDSADASGWQHLGEMQSATVSLQREFLDVFSTLDGLRDRAARITISEQFDVRMVAREPTELIGALFFSASPTAKLNGAIAGFTKHAMISAVRLGRYYEIMDGDGVLAAGIDKADLALAAPAATTVTAAGGRTLTFAASGKTITASSGSFLDDGFRPGRDLVVTGTTDNNDTFTIVSVTETVITVEEDLVNEGPLNSAAELDSPEAALVEGVDYEVDESPAQVFMLPTSPGVLEGDTVLATLAANGDAEPMRKIEAQSRGEVTGALKLIGRNPRNKTHGRSAAYALVIPRCAVNADGEFSPIQEQEITTIPLIASGLKLDETTPIATVYALPAGGAAA